VKLQNYSLLITKANNEQHVQYRARVKIWVKVDCVANQSIITEFCSNAKIQIDDTFLVNKTAKKCYAIYKLHVRLIT